MLPERPLAVFVMDGYKVNDFGYSLGFAKEFGTAVLSHAVGTAQPQHQPNLTPLQLGVST